MDIVKSHMHRSIARLLQQGLQPMQALFLHAGSAVTHRNLQHIFPAADLQRKADFPLCICSVFDGILYNRLQQKFRHDAIHRLGRLFLRINQTCTKTLLLDIQIAFQIGKILLKPDLTDRVVDAVAQKLAEAEAKIKALEAQSKATAKTAAPTQPSQSQAAEVKRTKKVLTEHGWTSVEE